MPLRAFWLFPPWDTDKSSGFVPFSVVVAMPLRAFWLFLRDKLTGVTCSYEGRNAPPGILVISSRTRQEHRNGTPSRNAPPGILVISSYSTHENQTRATSVAMPLRAFWLFLQCAQTCAGYNRPGSMSQCPSGHFGYFFLLAVGASFMLTPCRNAPPGILVISSC
jgi:hypothetical protein